jgi:hypothetical protein
MTLRELLPLYKEKFMETKKLILCNWSSQNGCEINNIEEFEKVLQLFGDNEVYLLNNSETKDFHFFEYFIMRKTEPYVVVLKHPLMTNAFWRDLPDNINDMFVSEQSGVYRYLMVDYGKKIRDYVIEMPTTIDDEIFNFCKEKMPKGFKGVNHSTSNISILFTNSSRFEDLNLKNFVIYELEDLYKDWNIKNITTLNLSRKLWTDIKKLGQNK